MLIQDFAKTVPENTQVVIHTKTLVKMNKKDVETKTIPNPFGEIYKISSTRVTLNASYEDRVNESRAEEGKDTDFKASEMTYGTMVGNALLENNGALYVKCIEEGRVGESQYVNAEDEVIDYAEIKPFIPVKKPSASQAVEKEVKARNYKLESIMGYEVI